MQILSFFLEGRLINGKKFKYEIPFEDRTTRDSFELKTEYLPLPEGYRIKMKLNPLHPIFLDRVLALVSTGLDNQDKILVNGYQSWSETREVGRFDRIKGLRGLLKPLWRHYRMDLYGQHWFRPLPEGAGRFDSWTWTYHRRGEDFWLGASVDESRGFTVFSWDCKKNCIRVEKEWKKSPLESTEEIFDLVFLQGKEAEVFDAWNRENKGGKPIFLGAKKSPSLGWTSWYHYYTNISQEILEQEIDSQARENRSWEWFQIDDGWQKAVGDWEPNGKFPGGMKPLAERIRQAGWKPGLWLAPFIAEKKSELVKTHPEWVKKDLRGRWVEAGFGVLWSGEFYALEWTNLAFQDHLRRTFLHLAAEGYALVKLDFLYAACLGVGPESKGEQMTRALDFLRTCWPDKSILACGLPLGAGFGRVDYCRIGPDVGLEWEDWRLKSLVRFPERVSTAQALENTLFRRQLSGRGWVNDPDVFILRKKNHKLTPLQQEKLLRVNLALGGLVYSSDPAGTWTKEDREKLKTLCTTPSLVSFSPEGHTKVIDAWGLIPEIQ